VSETSAVSTGSSLCAQLSVSQSDDVIVATQVMSTTMLFSGFNVVERRAVSVVDEVVQVNQTVLLASAQQSTNQSFYTGRLNIIQYMQITFGF